MSNSRSINPLRILNPLPVTESILTASSVTENDYAAWNAATAYNVGDRVIRTSTHRVYERLIAGTTATAPESDAANWLDVSATNRWKMFDSVVSSQTTSAASIVVTLTPGTTHNAVALVNVTGTSVRVKQTNTTDGVVYDRTINLQAPPSQPDWWTYFFEPIYQRQTALALDMPTYGVGTTVEITIANTGGNAACGALLIGTALSVGELGVQRGAQIGITDYSRKERNAFGESIIVERAWNKRSVMDVLIPNSQVDAVQSLFASIRAVPTLWVGSDAFESLAVYGFYKDFAAVIAYPDFSQCHLEIEGLI